MLLLLGWIALGLGHTAISMLRPGFDPARPPAVGVPSPGLVEDVGALHGMLRGRDSARVFLQLSPTADSAQVLYLRYQLAHILYPLEIFGGRPATGSPPGPRAGFDLLVTGPGTRQAAGWRPAADTAGFTLWLPETP